MSDSQGFVKNTPITEVSVTEVAVSQTGTYVEQKPVVHRLSKASLWLGIFSLALAPLFGLGVLVALPSLVVGHLARGREPRGVMSSTVGLWLTYLALIIGIAVLVFVALPLTLAFLISMGYILAD
jgi:hypothetical protein